MTLSNLAKMLSVGAVALTVPAVAQAEAAGMQQPIYSGRSVSHMHKKHHRSTGSYTGGVPDGAGTGARKQSPTGGNPGGSGGKS